MRKVQLNKDRCDNQTFCPAKRTCPFGAIVYKKKGFFSGNITIEEEKCKGCGKCVTVCPHSALTVR